MIIFMRWVYIRTRRLLNVAVCKKIYKNIHKLVRVCGWRLGNSKNNFVCLFFIIFLCINPTNIFIQGSTPANCFADVIIDRNGK